MQLEKDIEIIGLPQDGRFKVVQLLFEGNPIMLCGDIFGLHCEILRNYLDKTATPYQPRIVQIIGGEKTVPELFGKNYRVSGMGESEICVPEKRFVLPFGESHDYGNSPSCAFDKRLRIQFKDWNLK